MNQIDSDLDTAPGSGNQIGSELSTGPCPGNQIDSEVGPDPCFGNQIGSFLTMDGRGGSELCFLKGGLEALASGVRSVLGAVCENSAALNGATRMPQP